MFKNFCNFSISPLELIDTLWNVNKDGCEYVAVDFTELIDTLWNVNLYYRTFVLYYQV